MGTTDQTKLIILGWLFGWLSGMFSPLIVNSIQRRREASKVKVALGTELHELQYRLATSIHQIEYYLGEINRERLEWFGKILRGYHGVRSSQEILRGVERILEHTDQEIAALVQQTQSSTERILSLKKYALPFLDSSIGTLSWLNEKSRNVLLAMKTNLDFLNEEIDHARYFLNLTYQGNITPENFKRACEILNICYRNYASQARIIIDLINKLKL